ncbi:tryptophan-rich sensory protein [Candidatus Saccharibacteria bacterium]|nr:tryptophan-rich sensory protein [Candidatus Saccharibacteria bacterium]
MFWKKRKDSTQLRWAVAGTFGLMVIVNALANILPIAGVTTGAVSDSYPNLFAPSGFTFAVWGVIYLLLAIYTLYQLGVIGVKKPGLKQQTVDKVSQYFVASSLINSVWIFAWHFRVMWLSVLLIAGLLYCLIRINDLLSKDSMTARENWLVKVPFGVYAGWITVATIANVTTWLVSIGWDGGGLSQGFWTVALLVVSAVIAIATMMRYDSWAYGAVVVWAYAGILTKHLSETGWNGQWPSVLAALYIIMPILIIATLDVARRQIRR